ncbi:hypothetical protein [Viscerimonas tarda]
MMMKELLEKDFIFHYKLAVKPSVNVVSTNNGDFDLKDDTTLVYPKGLGIAKYSNLSLKEVNIINYELFFRSLPQFFQNNKKICDLIVYTSDSRYFLLNELTNTNKGKGRKETKAISQMLQTIQILSGVPEILRFVQQHLVRQCCFFNKKAQSPKHIKATEAFGRLPTLSPHGFKMTNPDIESYDFELWEFSGEQTYLLKSSSTNPIDFAESPVNMADKRSK